MSSSADASSSKGNGKAAPRPYPIIVFRGDGREPEEIFKQGFTARGSNMDMEKHVRGGPEESKDTAYISTSASLRCPGMFVPPLIDDHVLYKAKDGRIYEHRRGWIYHIKPTNLTMHYAVDEIRPAMRASYEYQQEWAVEHHIPGKNIKEGWLVDGYMRKSSEESWPDKKPKMLWPIGEKPDPYGSGVKKINGDYAFKN